MRLVYAHSRTRTRIVRHAARLQDGARAHYCYCYYRARVVWVYAGEATGLFLLWGCFLFVVMRVEEGT